MPMEQEEYNAMFEKHFLEQVLDTEKFKAFYLKEPGMGRMQSCLILFTPEGIIICGDLCPGNDPRNSGVHAFGYGLTWFAGHLSSGYLCEKFLSKEWHKELAIEDCRDRAEEILDGETIHFDYDPVLEDAMEERDALAPELRAYLEDRRHPTPFIPSKEDILSLITPLREKGAALKKAIREQRQFHADHYFALANEVDDGEMGIESFGRAMSEIDQDFYECCPGFGYHPRSKYLLVAIQKKFSELYTLARGVTTA